MTYEKAVKAPARALDGIGKKLPWKAIVLTSYGIVFRHGVTLLRASIVPVALGLLAFYLAMQAYLLKLAEILHTHSERDATLVLGIASAGFLLCLFAHAVAATGIAETVAGERGDGGILRLTIMPADLRLYAATLRLVLVICFIQGAGFGVVQFLKRAGFASPELQQIVYACGGATIFFIIVRWGLLLPPLAIQERASVLRRAFQLTSGHTLPMIGVTLLLLLPGIFVQVLGEYIIHASSLMPLLRSNAELKESVRVFYPLLPYFILILGSSYLISLILVTVGSTVLYQYLRAQG